MSTRARQARDVFFSGLVRGCAYAMVLAVIAILATLFVKGYDALSWEFLAEVPKEGMTAGGIFPAIFGTLCIVILMILMALPLGILAAIYLVEYAGTRFVARVVRAAVNNLAGVPSIVFGLFGVGFFILFVGRFIDRATGYDHVFGQPAMLWAAATLAVLVLPVVIVTTEEALLAVPLAHREAAYALGATKWQVLSRVVLPQCRAGILTGAILSVSRGAGETAPILFTGCAYFLPRLPLWTVPGLGIPIVNPLDQFMELSYHIFILATQSTDTALTRPLQYGTTLVLLGVTFLLNAGALTLRYRFRRRVARA